METVLKAQILHLDYVALLFRFIIGDFMSNFRSLILLRGNFLILSSLPFFFYVLLQPVLLSRTAAPLEIPPLGIKKV